MAEARLEGECVSPRSLDQTARWRHRSWVIVPPGLPTGCPPWFAHPAARLWTCAPAPAAEVRAFHAGLPGYAPTPLAEVPALAAELKVGRVFVKDESARMGLPAFKVLGASWAVHQLLSGRPAGGPLTLVTATDGNHGRALARMARLFGQRAQVFVPGGVHPTAVAAIASEGAQVTEITGTYDDAVRLAAEAADMPGGHRWLFPPTRRSCCLVPKDPPLTRCRHVHSLPRPAARRKAVRAGRRPGGCDRSHLLRPLIRLRQ